VLAIADKALALTALQPVIEVGNPLGEYPDRSWERVYHDQYRYDSSFTYICTPNDTNGCRVRAFVRNGVVMRVEQNYDTRPMRTCTATADVCVEPADVPEGVHVPPAGVWAVPAEGPDAAQGLEGLGGRWLSGAESKLSEVSVHQPRRGRHAAGVLGHDGHIPGEGADQDRGAVFGRGRRAAPARAGVPAGDDRVHEGGGTRTFKYRPGMALLGLIGKIGFGRMSNSNLGDARRPMSEGGAGQGGGRPDVVELTRGTATSPVPSLTGTATQTSDIDHPDTVARHVRRPPPCPAPTLRT